MGAVNKIHYGASQFQATRGVVQGGILSPQLFNFYLDKALQSDPLLKRMIEDMRLMAFADDILIRVKGVRELQSVIASLESLEASYDLILNKTKTVFLAKDKSIKQNDEVAGVRRVDETKYLGVRVSLNKGAIKEKAKSQVMRNVASLKSRLRLLNNECINSVYTSYIRSLLVYYITPMVATAIMKKEEIAKLEGHIKRKILGFPNDIRTSVLNSITNTYKESTTDLISRLADTVQLKVNMQPKIP